MIKDVAKEIIKIFQVNRFLASGIDDGDTPGTVKEWFNELNGDGEGKNIYSLTVVDADRERCDKAAEKYKESNSVRIVNGSSIEYLKRSINEGEFGDGDCMFYLNACGDDYGLLKNEIREVLRLEKSIILIDNFYTPGKPFEYATHKGKRLDLNCIRGDIGGRTDCIYYAAIANRDNRGMAVIIAGYEEEERDGKLKGLPLIREGLDTGELSLLGRSGRVLMMGIGKHTVRTIIPNLFFENYISSCMSGYEIITFGHNEGVDIQIEVEDDFAKVMDALPNGWLPDICILPECEFLLIPNGIENAPCFTVYVSYDWDYHVLTSKTFVEAVDLTIHDGDVSIESLSALGANAIDRFYAHGVRKEFFAESPRKMKDRKYDILYATSVDDVTWPDRSEWILKLCELADKYKVHIVPHTNYHSYFELLSNSKLAFSHNRIGEMSLRLAEASSQGAVTVETGNAVKKYFEDAKEYVAVTKENVDEQIEKYLADEDKLQEISDRVYSKALREFEPRYLFVKLIERLYEKLGDKITFERKFNKLTEGERHIRRGEIYYFLFFECVKGLGWLNNYKSLLQLSIKEFEKAVAAEPSARAKLDLAVAEAAYCFHNYGDDDLGAKVKDVVLSFEEVISEHPEYAAAYFNLGLVHLRAGSHDKAFAVFFEALTLVKDPDGCVDPWCLYNTDIEINSKTNFTFAKALNSSIVQYSRGTESALLNIRKLYQAAVLYYLSHLYGKKGMLHDALEALLEAGRLYPESGLVAKKTAKKMALLNMKHDCLNMYKKALELLPFDIGLRIEYINLLYLYRMDREAMKEIYDALTITGKVDNFRDDVPMLNKTIKDLSRYNESAGYSHDSCREIILNNYIDILYPLLKKNPGDIRLVLRMVEIWAELGRGEKIYEIIEDYIANHMQQDPDGSTLSYMNGFYDMLNSIAKQTKTDFNLRIKRLQALIADLPVTDDNMCQCESAFSSETING